MIASPDGLPEATVREVQSMVARYRDRFNANDANGLAELYSADISFVNLVGEPYIGRRAIRDQQVGGLQGPLARISITLEIEATHTLGVDYVLVLVRQTIADQNIPSGATSVSTMTMILDHTSGSWLIRHLQSTPIQAPWPEPTERADT